MIAAHPHTTPITPLRRGLADMMAATERHRGAYDAIFGRPNYCRPRDLPLIFGPSPISTIRAPRGLELVATELVLAALRNYRRRLSRAGSIERLARVDIALLGEGRIRARQLAKQRMNDHAS